MKLLGESVDSERSKFRNGWKDPIVLPSLDHVLHDVEVKFLWNLPEEELSNANRLFFQIEQAYWFYEDFYADSHCHLPHYRSLDAFAQTLFDHCLLLKPHQALCAPLFQEFRYYKTLVPVAGVVIVNPFRSKVLLVKGWTGSTWSFPRGKINHGESLIECAVREATEECGYDCKDKLCDEYSVTLFSNGQQITLYLVFDAPEDFCFAPTARKEISACEWFELENLPKTFSVLPFMARLKRIILSDDKSSNATDRQPHLLVSKEKKGENTLGQRRQTTPRRRRKKASGGLCQKALEIRPHTAPPSLRRSKKLCAPHHGNSHSSIKEERKKINR